MRFRFFVAFFFGLCVAACGGSNLPAELPGEDPPPTMAAAPVEQQTTGEDQAAYYAEIVRQYYVAEKGEEDSSPTMSKVECDKLDKEIKGLIELSKTPYDKLFSKVELGIVACQLPRECDALRAAVHTDNHYKACFYLGRCEERLTALDTPWEFEGLRELTRTVSCKKEN